MGGRGLLWRPEHELVTDSPTVEGSPEICPRLKDISVLGNNEMA
jgi:hypothetical protein